jgi:hypothetical protein
MYGLRSKCRNCKAKEDFEYNSMNKEKVSEKGKRYRKENAEKISVQRAIHRVKNKDRLTQYAKNYRKNNSGKRNARTAKRRACKRQATPKWLTTDHWKQIEIFYVKAVEITKNTGIPHEVDHIIPLQGKNVKGLHVPWNLRVITRTENRKKSKKIL